MDFELVGRYTDSIFKSLHTHTQLNIGRINITSSQTRMFSKATASFISDMQTDVQVTPYTTEYDMLKTLILGKVMNPKWHAREG